MKIYSSRCSEVDFDQPRRMLSMVWSKDSQKLNEEEVKAEMNRILSFIEQYSVKKVIIDARNYAFRDNLSLQNWITRNYMPQIVDRGIMKYAIIVSFQTKREEDPETVEPQVEYFNNYDEALQWI